VPRATRAMKSEKPHTAEYESLTPLYARWMDDLLGGPIPRESRATCDDCAMCAKPGDPAGGDESFFDPAIKCCSTVPELSNFLVGGILAEAEAASGSDAGSVRGRESIVRRIAESGAVSPLGLGQSPAFKLIYENSDPAFGRSLSLRCPHYLEDSGRCGIRNHRPGICVTWFCKHVRGNVGRAFWRDWLEKLFIDVERSLGTWCVLKLDIGLEALRELYTPGGDVQPGALTAAQLDNRANPARQRRIWGKWFGREEAFFMECARLVEPLSWQEVIGICDPEANILASLTRRAYDRLVSDEVPPALKVGSFQLVQITNGLSRARSYSPLDPLDVPLPVMESLRYFDGRPTEEALGQIASEKGISLSDDLVRKLCDFELLVAADAS
jgi:hypothetical protein